MFKINISNLKRTYRVLITFILSLVILLTSIPIPTIAEESETPPTSIPKRFFSLGISNMDLYTKGYAKKNGIYKSTESHADIWVVCYRNNGKDYLISQQPTGGGIVGASQTDIINARCISRSDIRPHPNSHWQEQITSTVENVKLLHGNKTYQGYPITGIKTIKAILPNTACVEGGPPVASSSVTIINDYRVPMRN